MNLVKEIIIVDGGSTDDTIRDSKKRRCESRY